MSIPRSPYTIDDLPLEWFTFVLKTKGYEPLVIDRDYMDRGQSIGGEEDLISVTFKGENAKRIFFWGYWSVCFPFWDSLLPLCSAGMQDRMKAKSRFRRKSKRKTRMRQKKKGNLVGKC